MIAGATRQGGGGSHVMTRAALLTCESKYNIFPPLWAWWVKSGCNDSVRLYRAMWFSWFSQKARDASTALRRCCSVPWWPVTILIPFFLCFSYCLFSVLSFICFPYPSTLVIFVNRVAFLLVLYRLFKFTWDWRRISLLLHSEVLLHQLGPDFWESPWASLKVWLSLAPFRHSCLSRSAWVFPRRCLPWTSKHLSAPRAAPTR